MQGFNMGRYVPPELEGTTTGNQLHRKRPPGSSGPGGAMTVRFEMPFAVWCAHCPQPTLIGQGVRFNAEKRRVGHYHSTPIFAFRMRHAACAGALEIRTDPQNTTYVVTEGGRKRDTGDNKGDDAGSAAPHAPTILTPRERDDLRGSAFAKLERTIEDRARLAAARDRIGELEAASARAWDDPYERNRVLRREFRAARHERERDARDADDLRDRLGFGPELVPASEDDARRAALVDFRPVPDDDDGGTAAAAKVLARPLFEASGVPKQQQQQQQKVSVSKSTLATTATNNTTKTKEKEKAKKTKAKTKPKTKPLKSEIAASQSRETLVSEIVGNTRAAHDPFLAPTTSTTKILGIKRKRQQDEEPEPEPGEEEEKEEEKEVAVGVSSSSAKANITGSRLLAAAVSGTPAATTTSLVEYDSDST